MRAAALGIAKGEPPSTGRSVAGYYFNDALFRLDVGFETALRHLTGQKNGRIEDVTATAKAMIDSSLMRHWHPVRDELNTLKHRNPEQKTRHAEKRGVPLHVACAAAADLVQVLKRIVPGL
jgi:hypothetical protein